MSLAHFIKGGRHEVGASPQPAGGPAALAQVTVHSSRFVASVRITIAAMESRSTSTSIHKHAMLIILMLFISFTKQFL